MAKSPERLIGVVLAAGAGERMGGPKAMLVVDGVPLAIAHAGRLREAGCDVTVVTRAEVAPKLAGERVVVSGAPEPAGSLAVGLRAIGETPSPQPLPRKRGRGAEGSDTEAPHAPGDGVFAGDEDTILVITPVDALPARLDTIARLVAAVRAGASAATPTHGGRGGHPVVARASAIASMALDPRPLRDVLAELGETRVRIEVEDPAVAVDLDTADDVRRVTGEGPRFR